MTSPSASPTSETTRLPAFADRDGDLDAFVGELLGGTIFFENSGTASMPPLPRRSPGDLDASVGNFDGYTIFFPNTGTASAPAFAPPVTSPFGLAAVRALSSPVLADLDGDGELDVQAQISPHDPITARESLLLLPPSHPRGSGSALPAAAPPQRRPR